MSPVPAQLLVGRLHSPTAPDRLTHTTVLSLRLAAVLRADLIHTVAKTGGHLGSSLGVVELSVALHYVFNTPEDKVIWDVGHQAYIHKMLTGRRSRMHTIRQLNGLSGEQLGGQHELPGPSAGASAPRRQ